MWRASSVCPSIMMSMTSSTVTIPSSRFSSSTTGIAWTSYFETRRATSSWARRSSPSAGAAPSCRRSSGPAARGRVCRSGHGSRRGVAASSRAYRLWTVSTSGSMRFKWSSVSATVHSGRIVANFSVMRRPAVRCRVSGASRPRPRRAATCWRGWLRAGAATRCSRRKVSSSAGSRSSSGPSLAGEVRWRIRRSVSPFSSERTGGALLGRQHLEEHDAVLARQVAEQLREVGRVEVFATAAAQLLGLSRISSSMSGPMTLRGTCGGILPPVSAYAVSERKQSRTCERQILPAFGSAGFPAVSPPSSGPPSRSSRRDGTPSSRSARSSSRGRSRRGRRRRRRRGAARPRRSRRTASPTPSRPTRCLMVIFTSGNSRASPSAIRAICFSPDPDLPANVYHVTDFDYTGSGYDRGHMTTSEERTTTDQENATTYILTNVLPQLDANNAGPWEGFENFLNAQAQSGKEIYTVAGPQWGPTVHTLHGSGASPNKVQIPDFTWKVAVILNGGQGLADVHSSHDLQVLAVKMPNLSAADAATGLPGSSAANLSGLDYTPFLTSARAIEQATGLSLLTALPDSIRNIVETMDHPPTVSFTGTAALNEGGTASFDASASTDADAGDAVVKYVWNFGDGTPAVSGTTPTVTHVFADNGNFTVTLAAYDLRARAAWRRKWSRSPTLLRPPRSRRQPPASKARRSRSSSPAARMCRRSMPRRSPMRSIAAPAPTAPRRRRRPRRARRPTTVPSPFAARCSTRTAARPNTPRPSSSPTRRPPPCSTRRRPRRRARRSRCRSPTSSTRRPPTSRRDFRCGSTAAPASAPRPPRPA